MTQATDEDTHSHVSSLRAASSSPLPVSVALGMNRAPIPTTTEELRSEVCRLRMTMALLEKEIAQANAKADANNAQCAIMMRALSSEVGEPGFQKAKTTRRASKKGPRRVVAAPVAKGHSGAKRRRKARLAKTKVDNAAREA